MILYAGWNPPLILDRINHEEPRTLLGTLFGRYLCSDIGRILVCRDGETFHPSGSFLWQLFGIAIGAVGTFYSGRQSAAKAAREIVKPSARSAFRRLRSLYESISRVAYTIESSRNTESPADYRAILAELEGIVFVQLLTASDALQDWNDIIPEDVKALQNSLFADNATEDRP